MDAFRQRVADCVDHDLRGPEGGGEVFATCRRCAGRFKVTITEREETAVSTKHFVRMSEIGTAICGDSGLDANSLKMKWSQVTCPDCWRRAPDRTEDTPVKSTLSTVVEHEEATIEISISSEKHPAAVLVNALAVTANAAVKTTTTEAETATIIAGQEALDFLEKERLGGSEAPHYTESAFICACCDLWSSGAYHVQGLKKGDELRFCTDRCAACSHKNPRHR